MKQRTSFVKILYLQRYLKKNKDCSKTLLIIWYLCKNHIPFLATLTILSEQKTNQLHSSKQTTWLVFEEKSTDNQSLPMILDQFSMHLWCHFFIQWPHFLTVRYRNWISLFLAMLFYGLKLFKETVKLVLWKITILILKSTFFPKPFCEFLLYSTFLVLGVNN